MENTAITEIKPPTADETKAQEKQAQEITLEIVTLGQLKQVADNPVYCELKIDGKPVRIKCRRLTAAEYAEVSLIENSVVPPWVTVGDPKDAKRDKTLDHYDTHDPKFVQANLAAARDGRAVAVYRGCQAVQEAKPGLSKLEDIRAHVESQLSHALILSLYETILKAETAVEPLVNFT